MLKPAKASTSNKWKKPFYPFTKISPTFLPSCKWYPIRYGNSWWSVNVAFFGHAFSVFSAQIQSYWQLPLGNIAAALEFLLCWFAVGYFPDLEYSWTTNVYRGKTDFPLFSAAMFQNLKQAFGIATILATKNRWQML